MNYTNPGYHVPEIEINNITVKEIYHAQYTRLHFQHIPKVIIRYLDFEVVKKLNCFPVKVGISPYCSPQTIVYQKTFDYNKHFTIPFGAFFQANNDSNQTNSNALWTIDGIYLLALSQIQEGHEIFDPRSHKVITRPNIIEIPIPKEMMKRI